ncbi:hypothetical protein [Paenibacillus daejeonensis]|uniref:hypothetical protein n=1 Tax=Paenibacillus daejeonensis TaxID=135193 RepID=UPI000360D9EB|nr:hypothetical protein [Paenibacillus daejeonensis]
MSGIGAYSAWLYRRMNGWAVVAGIIVFALFIGWVLPSEAERSSAATGGGESPDSSFYYSAGDLYEMAESYGEEGRAYYIRARFTFDLIWPLAYGLFLTAALTQLYRFLRPESKGRLINLLPTAAVGFDYAENVAASWVMYRYPDRTSIVADLSTVFTMLKWSLLYASFALLVLGILLLGWRSLRRWRAS